MLVVPKVVSREVWMCLFLLAACTETVHLRIVETVFALGLTRIALGGSLKVLRMVVQQACVCKHQRRTFRRKFGTRGDWLREEVHPTPPALRQ